MHILCIIYIHIRTVAGHSIVLCTFTDGLTHQLAFAALYSHPVLPHDVRGPGASPAMLCLVAGRETLVWL